MTVIRGPWRKPSRWRRALAEWSIAFGLLLVGAGLFVALLGWLG